MKIIRNAVIVLSLLAAPAWADAGAQVDHAPIDHAQVYHVGVNGLGCPFCAYGLEKAFGKVAGVERVEIDMQNGQVVLTMSRLAELGLTQGHEHTGAAVLLRVDQILTQFGELLQERVPGLRW